jgi:hypothetical protein
MVSSQLHAPVALRSGEIASSTYRIGGWVGWGLRVRVPVEVRFFLLSTSSLCLINYVPCHEDMWGSGGKAPLFLTLALDGEWSASRPGHFTLGEKAPNTHRIGGRVGPKAGVDAVKKRQCLAPAAEPVASHCTDWAIWTTVRIIEI